MATCTEVETISLSRRPGQQPLWNQEEPPSFRLPSFKKHITFRKKSQKRVFTSWAANLLSNLKYHLNTIWLFTFSDLKTIVGPQTAFGIVHAIYASQFGLSPLPFSCLVSRLPIVAFWCWINLLPFAISNQRQDAAIMEDKLNKPWRPLPSRRISQRQAKLLMLSLYSSAVFASFRIGGLYQSLALVVLGFLYNDCGGADRSCIVRNLLNGAGYISFASGALSAAFGTQFTPTIALARWLAVIFAVVTTSVHSQDLYDQEGDILRHRNTVPLVLGGGRSRWTIAMAVSFWSAFCPWFMGVGTVYIVPPVLGIIVMYRTLMKTTVKEDKTTFKIWNLWLVALYLSPVVSSHNRH